MRRIIGYEPLMFVVAVVLVAGCSSSSSPDLADGRGAPEARDAVLPDLPEAVDSATSERVGGVATTELDPAPAKLAEGADSDAPGNYLARPTEQPHDETHEASQTSNQVVKDDESPTTNDRLADGDDPESPLIVAKSVEPQDDEPLDNGREPSAKPIPEGQRAALASTKVAPEPTELGRDSNARPGAESTQPAKATPATKPAAPSRKTLADLSEAIQALDKDSDGQLGVYEWPREKLAEFKSLDADKDGFLTPAELVAGEKKPANAASPAADKKPAESSKEESDDKPALKTDDDSQPDDAKASTAEATDKEEKKEETKEETPDSSADDAAGTDEASAEDQPTQGS